MYKIQKKKKINSYYLAPEESLVYVDTKNKNASSEIKNKY
jgi:hypothetical protein